jgi:hypothetical protein
MVPGEDPDMQDWRGKSPGDEIMDIGLRFVQSCFTSKLILLFPS